MGFDADIRILKQTVLHRDPAFRALEPGVLSAHLTTLENAHSGSDDFLLAAMRLMALPGNGHSRVIPIASIRTFPVRFLSLASDIILPRGGDQADGSTLNTVNDVPVTVLCDAARPFLSGTAQRQNVLAPMLLAWPAALSALGVELSGGHVTYRLTGENGAPIELAFSIGNLVPASNNYPVHETGCRPSTAPHMHATLRDDRTLHIQIKTLKDVPPKQVQDTISTVEQSSKANLIVDVRGNPGGSFFHALPLIDGLATSWLGEHCVILVDKFTFSAAIVTVALLADRLGDRAVVMGEEMGDHLRFFAEGGTELLPESGGHVRYSEALHDWETGVADATTPKEIADKLVGVGFLSVAPIRASGHDIWRGSDPMLEGARRALHP